MKENEYQEILEYYIDLEARNLSEFFLKKYWLTNTEMLNFWIPIKNRIFNINSIDLPDLMFNKGFELIAQRGGILFTKEEYFALQNCMKVAGDKYFVLIENKFTRNTEGDFPHLRFKFPADTTWEMLNNGDENFPDISSEAIFIMNKHFFVFGDSGKWGKYAASDYHNTPLDIIGFKPNLNSIFKEQFKQSKEDQDEIREWLPKNYRNHVDRKGSVP
jgi:hypothetical protein